MGCQEWVSIPGWGIKRILAKIDTGAYTGAIHCEEVKVVTQKGQEFLTFKPLNKRQPAQKTEIFRKLAVKSTSGHRAVRYVVPAEIVINDKAYKTHISLTDRMNMRRQVLIGRRFLREHGMLVDVNINQELDDERETVL